MSIKLKPMSVCLSEGHADLLIERDSGNKVLILFGGKKYALPSWEKLRDLCDEAIEYLEEQNGN